MRPLVLVWGLLLAMPSVAGVGYVGQMKTNGTGSIVYAATPGNILLVATMSPNAGTMSDDGGNTYTVVGSIYDSGSYHRFSIAPVIAATTALSYSDVGSYTAIIVMEFSGVSGIGASSTLGGGQASMSLTTTQDKSWVFVAYDTPYQWWQAGSMGEQETASAPASIITKLVTDVANGVAVTIATKDRFNDNAMGATIVELLETAPPGVGPSPGRRRQRREPQ